METALLPIPADRPTNAGGTDYQNTMVDMLTCRIGEQQYGVPVAAVREVVRLPSLLSLAGAPTCCCGLLNIRGTYVPVVDGRVLLEMAPSYDLSKQIIILGKDVAETGFLVDEVCDVRLLPVNHATFYRVDTATKVLHGVVSSGDSTIMLLNVDVLRGLVPSASLPASG